MKRLLTGAGFFIIAAVLAYSVSAPVYAPLRPPEQPVRVLFVGDIMLDRNVARTISAEGPDTLFAGVRTLLADADVRVGNLEGTITRNPSIAQQNNKVLRFTFDPTQAKAVLAPLHFDAFSLANNHTLDFGEFGYDETRERLAGSIGAQPFGQPFNDKSRISTTVQSRGKTLCFVGYMQLFAPATSTVVDEIETIKPNCWRVIVFAHWGEEYQATSTVAQQSAAHAFIDAGADLVVGAHPHVVQNVEVYKDKAIFYSLGNFMFDQNFSWNTTHGLAVRADFYEDKTHFILTPTVIAEQHASVGTSSAPTTFSVGGPTEASGLLR